MFSDESKLQECTELWALAEQRLCPLLELNHQRAHVEIDLFEVLGAQPADGNRRLQRSEPGERCDKRIRRDGCRSEESLQTLLPSLMPALQPIRVTLRRRSPSSFEATRSSERLS